MALTLDTVMADAAYQTKDTYVTKGGRGLHGHRYYSNQHERSGTQWLGWRENHYKYDPDRRSFERRASVQQLDVFS